MPYINLIQTDLPVYTSTNDTFLVSLGQEFSDPTYNRVSIWCCFNATPISRINNAISDTKRLTNKCHSQGVKVGTSGRQNERNSNYVRLAHTSIFGLCFLSVCLIKSNCYSLIYSSLVIPQ